MQVKGNLLPEAVQLAGIGKVLLAREDAVIPDGAEGVCPGGGIEGEMTGVVPSAGIAVDMAPGHETHATGGAQG